MNVLRTHGASLRDTPCRGPSPLWSQKMPELPWRSTNWSVEVTRLQENFTSSHSARFFFKLFFSADHEVNWWDRSQQQAGADPGQLHHRKGPESTSVEGWGSGPAGLPDVGPAGGGEEPEGLAADGLLSQRLCPLANTGQTSAEVGATHGFLLLNNSH